MGDAVSIVGRAALTGAGTGVDALWNAMVAARPGVAEHDLGDPRFTAHGEPPRFVAAVTDRRFDDEPARQWLACVIADAVADAGLERLPARTALLTGTSLGGMAAAEQLHRSWWGAAGDAGPGQVVGPASHRARDTRYDGPASTVARQQKIDGGGWTLNTACSSAANALGLARLWLSRGRIDAAVVAGVDVISPFVYAGFGCLQAMDREASAPFCAVRAGLNLGDAAIAFVLVRDEAGERSKGTGRTRLVGYASSCDAHHLTRPDLSGGGLSRAIRGALADAAVAPGNIDFISAHGTGTPFNDTMEAAAFVAVFGPDSCPPIHCAKPITGHTLGAAGAVDALVVTEALRRGMLPPTFFRGEPDPELAVHPQRTSLELSDTGLALSTSSGFGGSNAALVFAGPGQESP